MFLKKTLSHIFVFKMVLVYCYCKKACKFLFLSLVIPQQNISQTFWNLKCFLKLRCPIFSFLKLVRINKYGWKKPNFLFLSLVRQQWNISVNSQNFIISFLKWICPTKMLLKSFPGSNNPKMSTSLLLIILLNEQNFQNLLCLWTPWVLLSRSQLVRNLFLLPLPKNNQMLWCNLLVTSDKIWNVRALTNRSSKLEKAITKQF